uniref:Ubiquitin-like domain-containing protein n=1 Tax=Paramormyrops kingsleyae TaxID=1676925 RepID=A0A3B3RSD4_9TELE
MADEKPKEGVKTENNDHINLKVAGQDGSVVQFKIKRHTPLSKLMKAYCERQGLTMRQIRFRFDGQPINETDTPAQVHRDFYSFVADCCDFILLHSWKWRMKIPLMFFSSKQEANIRSSVPQASAPPDPFLSPSLFHQYFSLHRPLSQHRMTSIQTEGSL